MDVWVSPTIDHYVPLLERLRFEPNSLWRAKELGSKSHFGWSQDTYLLAALTDATHTQLKGKKLSERQRVAVPKVVKQKNETPKFDPKAPIKDLHLGRIYPD